MKKFLLSYSLIAVFAAYVMFQRYGAAAGPKVNPLWDNQASVTNTAPAIVKHGFKDGTYTGSVADAYYGNIQVQAIIQSGQISDVQFLQYPNDRRNSIAINTQAMPYLRSEAIRAQSANVDIVSGATDTSAAFRQSLAVALDQAKY